MYQKYLSLCNLIVPINDGNEVPAQLLTYAFCKLVSNAMMVFDSRKVKLCIHKKQHSNAFSNFSNLTKKLANNKLENCRYLSMHNNLNIDCTINDIDCSSLIKHTHTKQIYINKKEYKPQKRNLLVRRETLVRL